MKLSKFAVLLFAVLAVAVLAAFGSPFDPVATVVTAMASAIPTQGVVFKVSVPGSPTQLLAVGNLTSFNLNGSAPEIDTTNLDSLAAEVLTGVPKYTFSGTLNLDPDNSRHQELLAALANRTKIQGQVTLTDATPATCTFNGYMTGWNPSGGLNDKVTVSFSMAIDGGWLWA